MLLVLSSTVFAETEEMDDTPDMEFLEYLGMWDETDEDWQLLNEETDAGNEAQSDVAAKDDESLENEDES